MNQVYLPTFSACVELEGLKLVLLPEKAIFIPGEKSLLLADLHLGKINHFRRAGIPLPSKANDENLERLIDLINKTNADRVIFLGDLFHSHYNSEWESLGQVLRHFPGCEFHLVLGNHDIMSQLQYERYRIKICDELHLGPLLLTHELMDNSQKYNLAGHVHPGVRLTGRGKQSMMLPCFYFGERKGLMPAFGSFTGLARVAIKKEDRVFAIADGKVLNLDNA
ncbi:MAG: ligase-associated DNA damage response endonuclease PdeM [Cyclobacteriaceae bacterium]|nr:ligase-associated DNA damage response endonuclease PdeM [Cyclobacteriaceae bacterium]